MPEEMEKPVGETEEVTEAEMEPVAEAEFVEKEKFDKVLKETLNRKKKIRELEAQIEELSNATKKTEEITSDVTKYKTLLSEKEKEIQTLRYMSRVRTQVEALGSLNSRVAELAFLDAQKEDVLDDDTALVDFLKSWKKDNTDFFKSEKPKVTVPLETRATVVEPTVAVTPEAKYQQFLEMTPEQRLKLNPEEHRKMMDLGYRLAGRTFKPAQN